MILPGGNNPLIVSNCYMGDTTLAHCLLFSMTHNKYQKEG